MGVSEDPVNRGTISVLNRSKRWVASIHELPRRGLLGNSGVVGSEELNKTSSSLELLLLLTTLLKGEFLSAPTTLEDRTSLRTPVGFAS